MPGVGCQREGAGVTRYDCSGIMADGRASQAIAGVRRGCSFMAMTEMKDIRQEPWYERLFLPAYRISDAARYAGAHPNTVAAWHRGENPLLSGLERREGLSYVQLVEVAFVSFFRNVGLTMSRIRTARRYLSQEFQSEFPFTQYQFMADGADILMDYFGARGSTPERRVVATSKYGQLAWTNLLGEKFTEFDYQYEIALRWYPAGRKSQVTIDPRLRFGQPSVQGLETWAIKGSYEAGETPEEIGEDYQITIEGVLDALQFEGVGEAQRA